MLHQRGIVVLFLTCTGTSFVTAQAESPPDGAVLNRIHERFAWSAAEGATRYQLVVALDNGAKDPFDGATPVIDFTVGTLSAVIMQGLAFGGQYAWRVRGLAGDPLDWGPTYRFDTIPIPANLPAWTVTLAEGVDASDLEPGITLFNLRSGTGLFTGEYALAVDPSGDLIWILNMPNGVGDLRLLRNGHALFITGGQAVETTLDGTILHATPEEYDIHHEVFPMPNGNYLALVTHSQEVDVGGGVFETWVGNRIIEFERDTNAILFDWNEFDNFSTLDFDGQFGGGDWTHSNAVIYNPLDNSIYHSARHLSRITRIDYATGDVVYMMGFEMPSGDADFGDNLFSFQHSPQMLTNGNMMVYDNGNRRDHVNQTNQTGVTKAIELQLTGDPPTDASIVWEYTLPSYNFALGDADRLLGGNTLVVGGTAAAIYEVDPAAIELWRLQVSGVFPAVLIYRAERIPCLIAPKPGGLNADEKVDAADLASLLGAWGPNLDHPADLNGDGMVNAGDLAMLLGNWD